MNPLCYEIYVHFFFTKFILRGWPQRQQEMLYPSYTGGGGGGASPWVTGFEFGSVDQQVRNRGINHLIFLKST